MVNMERAAADPEEFMGGMGEVTEEKVVEKKVTSLAEQNAQIINKYSNKENVFKKAATDPLRSKKKA